MLVLSRRTGEQIVIAGEVCVKVVSIEKGRVRLGVTAPPSIEVNRSEVHERRQDALRTLEPAKTVPDSI